MVKRIPMVDPTSRPDEIFTLYSIPAFDRGIPDLLPSKEIRSSKKLVQDQDILLSRIVPHIRRAWIVAAGSERTTLASVEWIVFRAGDAIPEYLRFFLISDRFHRQFMETVAGVGGSLLRARPSLVASIEIPLPPLDEQRRIVGELEREMAATERARTAARERLALAEALPGAILRRAFAPGAPHDRD